MPLQNPPDWWDYDLELSPHLLDRMIDRGFSEVDLRIMIENCDTIEAASRSDRWILGTMHSGDRWVVIVEPDTHDQVTVVITAYRVDDR